MTAPRAGLHLFLASLLLADPAPAQPLPADDPEPDRQRPPLTLTYVEGAVDIVRNGSLETATPPDVFDEDERLVTSEGRAEMVFDDGTMAHIDRASDLRVDLGLRLRLVSGRAILYTPPDGESLEVATPVGLLRLDPSGVYDLTADDLRGDTVIAVVSGRATLLHGNQDTGIAPDDVVTVHPRDGRLRWARGQPRDQFSDWSQRRAATMTASTSPTPLPAPVRPWGADLAMNGRWSTLPPYGAVWFPAAMPGWRPYVDGSWRFTRYGWTWIDRQRWAWPLHHYGRWGHHDVRGWYWIPHRTWGPAWVGWAVAADHVAWCPLGWNARPLLDFSLGLRVGPVGLWAGAWSIVPRRVLGARGVMSRHVQDPRHLPGPVLGGFVSQMVGPRGPAAAGDRFAVRPDRREPRPRGGSPEAVPRRRPVDPWPGLADADRSLGAPREVMGRRPGDAPAPEPRVPDTAAAIPRPPTREWSTDRPEGGRGDGRPVMPGGPVARPRYEPVPDDGGGRRRDPTRERAMPRRSPDSGDGAGPSAGLPGPSRSGRDGTERQGPRPQGGVGRPPAGDGAAEGVGPAASPGAARRRAG